MTTLVGRLRGGPWLLLMLAPLLAISPAVHAQPAPGYVVELQSAADARALHRDPMWLNLLHYKPLAGIGPLRSLADDADFFNDPAGRTDPAAELRGTLAAFFDDRLRKGEQPAQCRFRARYEWLREQLAFDASRLPPMPCPRYEAWRQGISADSLTLVYAAAFINSPASMFGHTLFRLNPPPSDEANALLAYSINYAVGTDARPDDPLFEIKGLFGLYAGEFTNAPYYLRVREYSHMEDRDIWEYDLALSPAELERFLAHTWELGYTRFDYWFFDENCSYHLLSLLDVARPTLQLTDRFSWRAVPSDTVKAVVGVPGLVKRRSYRPSATSQMLVRATALGPPSQALAKALALGEPAALPDDAAPRARTLDLAERYLSNLAARGQVGNDAAQARRIALLRQRAALPALPDVPVPEPDTAPETGHGTLRTDWLAGRQAGRAVLRLNAYPAYHELLDPDSGFATGAQIRFMATGVSVREGGGLRLDHLTPVDVLSVAPQHLLRDGLSWKVNGGWQRAFGAGPAAAPLVFGLNGGPGRAAALGGWLGYALMDNQLWWDTSGTDTHWRLGTGVHLGAYGDLLPGWRVQVDWRRRWFVQHAGVEQSLELRQRITLSHTLNAVATCRLARRGDAALQRECTAGVQVYW